MNVNPSFQTAAVISSDYQCLLQTITNASHHFCMLKVSSFSFMNMHRAITNNVTPEALLKLSGISD